MNRRTTPRILTGIIAGSLFGAATLSAFWWTKNPVQAWAWGHTDLTATRVVSQPSVLLVVAVFCLLVAVVFAFGGGAIFWTMKKIDRLSATNLVIVGGAVCFVTWYAVQVGLLLSGVLGISTDAGGVMVRGGAITAHGWEGAFRRSVLAGALGLAMAWVFCLTAGVKRSRV